MLSTEVADHPELVERVVHEAEFLHRINGAPHVVTVVDWGRLHDELRRPYLVMDRLDGETLSTLLKRGALPLAELLSCLRQVLCGVVAVHGAGVVHRDLKPSNIFVQRNGVCTLIDFSVLKALRDIGLSPRHFATAKGVPIGTPFYMAPEQASGANVDQRADIFSLGLVLAEGVLGHRLLRHLSEKEYLFKLVNEGVPSIELVGGDHVHSEVRRLIRRATLFDRTKRLPSAQAFLLEIDRIVALLGLHLRPIPPSVYLASGALPPRAADSHAPPTPRGYDSNAPTPRLGRAPSPLTPSGRAAPGAAAGPTTPPSSSAQPTQVDSVSPTHVKTPSPPSSPTSTPPFRSQWRHRFGLLTLGWNTPSARPGKGGEPPVRALPGKPPPTLPPPPPTWDGFSGHVPKYNDRLVLRPGMLRTPVNNLLWGPALTGEPAAFEPSAEAQPAFEPSAEAQPAFEPSAEAPPTRTPSAARPGALPAAAKPPLGPLLAIGFTGVAIGIVASIAVFLWAGPPATVARASSEPRQASPAGVIASAEAPAAPAPEPPAEPEPSEASPPARLPKVSPSSARGDRRTQLEAKLKSGKSTEGDVEELVLLCFRDGDEPCVRRAQDFRKKREGRR